MKKWIVNFFQPFLFFSIIQPSFAINLIPGSAQPGLVQKNYFPKSIPQAQPVPSVQSEEPKVTPLSKEAKKIKFKLTKIILKGNHVYSNKQLEAIYKDKLNTLISVVDLQNIVQDITNYYRNHGYILSQAYLPPQHIAEGIVHVNVLEGYIDKVNVIGDAKRARPLIQHMGERIAAVRPTQEDVMERYLYIANTIPGAQVKAVLEPSKTNVGASYLNLATTIQTITASLSYDNYGTLYLGPHEDTARIGLNSIALPGDNLNLTYLITTVGKELRYGDISYSTFLSSNGLQLLLDANKSLTIPGFVLAPLKTHGVANIYTAGLQYPVIRSRTQTLVLDGNIAYSNSQTTQLDILLYQDRIRPAQIGATYTLADSYGGNNYFTLHLMHGFNIWDASDDPDSLQTSHFGADGIFTKWNATVSRTQTIKGPVSAFILGQGQYSYNPLLVEEQYGFGGSQLGRGYDPAEILGDRGAAGSAELRLDVYPPDNVLFQTVQLYGYYDAGVVWNIDRLPALPIKQSATSAGVGARFSMLRRISGNVMWTQPLTKPVAAEAIIGCGKCPRVFFSLTAAV